MSKVNNFQEEFSLDDILIATEAAYTYDCGMSRIALRAPDQIEKRLGARVFKKFGNVFYNQLPIVTLKLHYAIQVWSKVAFVSARSYNRFEEYWQLDWKPGKGGFNNIEYDETLKKTSEKQMLQLFWKELEKTANSGKIKVSEGYWIKCGGIGVNGPKVKGYAIIDTETVDDVFIDDIHTYPYNKQQRTFKWNEIKDFFVELTLDQLRLTMPAQLHNHSSIDDTLLEACSKLDADMIKMAIERGANINCLDDEGVSPIVRVIDGCYDWNDDIGDEKMSQCKEVIDLLLSYGADINLFGYKCQTPLYRVCKRAYRTDRIELLKFLLERGASPNINCFGYDIADDSRQRNIRSSILEEYGDLYDEDDEVGRLLRAAGGRCFTYGYVPWNNENIGKYIVIMTPADDTGNFFIDNSVYPIGNATQLTIEDKDDKQIVISLADVADELMQWNADFRANIESRSYDRLAWKQRGLNLADRVAQLLPDTVALFYLYDIEQHITAGGTYAFYSLVREDDSFGRSFPLRIK